MFREDYAGIHAYLGIGTRAVTEGGNPKIYLHYVDSQSPGTSKELTLFINGKYTPPNGGCGFHSGFDSDFTEIQNALRTHCGANYVIPRN